jgi:hypothetical protein
MDQDVCNLYLRRMKRQYIIANDYEKHFKNVKTDLE